MNRFPQALLLHFIRKFQTDAGNIRLFFHANLLHFGSGSGRKEGGPPERNLLGAPPFQKRQLSGQDLRKSEHGASDDVVEIIVVIGRRVLDEGPSDIRPWYPG